MHITSKSRLYAVRFSQVDSMNVDSSMETEGKLVDRSRYVVETTILKGLFRKVSYAERTSRNAPQKDSTQHTAQNSLSSGLGQAVDCVQPISIFKNPMTTNVQLIVHVIAALVALYFHVTIGFNVDTENFIRHRGAPGSMFGFSVAEHRDRGTSWVLVGAPEAQTSQPGVRRGGAVYRCDVSRDDACQEVPFDVTGNNNNSEGRQIDLKSEQWFGATLQSSGEDGVVACAPRYVWFSQSLNRRDPVGTCYVARNSFREYSEYSPCRT
ncbi:hypothetical protein Cfor_05273, partial [Coptotermes formosanus]